MREIYFFVRRITDCLSLLFVLLVKMIFPSIFSAEMSSVFHNI